MCTLTCLPGAVLAPCEGLPLRLRVVFSRDERRTRSEGLAPEVIAYEGHKVLMPRDGEAGGTWIAANDLGVVFALLNLNPPRRSRQGDWHPHGSRLPVPSTDAGTGTADGRAVPVPSDDLAAGHARLLRDDFQTRGSVIAQLTDATSAAGAASRARALTFHAFRPFRVLAFDAAGQLAEVVWTGQRVRHRLARLSRPLLRTSSGLGDALVAEPRRRLFVRMLRAAEGRFVAAQDAFHRRQWPGREHVSVLMSRADARTVSITTVEVGEDGVRMEYLPLCP